MEKENEILEQFKPENLETDYWTILIADDESEVHLITRMVLEDYTFEGKPFKLISSYSSKETKAILSKNPEIALIILDVVMESDNSGLEIVKYIREKLKNQMIRIILRTGQPGTAPESRVIIDYDINDYKEKTELTSQKLITSVISALRSFRDIKFVYIKQRIIENSRNYIKFIINSLSSSIISIDNNFKIQLWNKASQILFTQDEESAIGKILWGIHNFFEKQKEKIIKSFDLESASFYTALPFGESTFVNFFLFPFMLNNNKGLLMQITDVTEQLHKDIELKKTQQLETINSFSSSLAHDINNSLCAITGTISLLEADLSSSLPDQANSSFASGLKTIKQSSIKASVIIEQLLMLTKKNVIQKESIDLNEVIKRLIFENKKTYGDSIQISVDFYKHPAHFNGNRVQIEHALSNILKNSADMLTSLRSPEESTGGKIKISLDQFFADKNFTAVHPKAKNILYWIIDFEDTGSGIEKDKIEYFFEPFADEKTSEIGSGLNLFLAQNIIQLHEGFIRIYSEKNKGTSIKIFLPVQGIQEEREENTELQTHRKEKLILICDDDQTIRNMLKANLKELNYDTIEAESGNQTIKLFKENNSAIDAVILDLYMKDSSGIEFLEKIRKINPETKIIISSGFKEDDNISEIIKKGNAVYLKKPYSISKLKKALETLFNN